MSSPIATFQTVATCLSNYIDLLNNKQNKANMTREQAISATLDQLLEVADTNNSEYGIASAIGEFEANGTMYQIQLQLVIGKKAWLKENEVMFLDIVNASRHTI